MMSVLKKVYLLFFLFFLIFPAIAKAQLSLSPQAVGFGIVPVLVDFSGPITFTVSQSDGFSDTIDLVTIESAEPGGADNFEIVEDNCSGSTLTDGADFCNIDVIGRPVTPGVHVASLRVQYSGESFLIATLNVVGVQEGAIGFSVPMYTFLEGTQGAEVPVLRLGDNLQDNASVNFVLNDGTAIEGIDYELDSPLNMTLEWPFADNEPKNILFNFEDNDIVDGLRSFDVILYQVQGEGQLIPERTVAKVNIIDNDVIEEVGTLNFSLPTYSFSEGVGVAEVFVVRNGGQSGEVTANVEAVSGTALLNQDFLPVTNPVVTFADGEYAAKPIFIPIIDDLFIESTESFFLQFLAPDPEDLLNGVGLGAPAIAEIVDNESPGTFQFSKMEWTFVEDQVGVVIQVDRIDGSGNNTVEVQVNVVSETAILGADFESPAGEQFNLTFLANDLSPQFIEFNILSDDIKDPGEFFSVLLSNPTNGGQIGSINSTKVNIVDNDNAGIFQFSQPEYTFGEGQMNVSIQVLRTEGAGNEVDLQVDVIDQTAILGEDFESPAGQVFNITFPDNDITPQFITFNILADNIEDPDEFFSVLLSNPTNGGMIGDINPTQVNIVDGAKAGNLEFVQEVYFFDENVGMAAIGVQRKGGVNGDVTVNCSTSDGTATNPNDYLEVVDQSLTFPNGDTSVQFCMVPIIPDATAEGEEVFYVHLSNPSNGAGLGEITTAEVRIVDNQGAGVVQFSLESFSFRGDVGTATVSVTREAGGEGTVSVDYTTAEGTATSPDNYITVSGTLTWVDGDQTPKFISIPIQALTSEDALNFLVVLSNPTGGSLLGDRETAQVFIQGVRGFEFSGGGNGCSLNDGGPSQATGTYFAWLAMAMFFGVLAFRLFRRRNLILGSLLLSLLFPVSFSACSDDEIIEAGPELIQAINALIDIVDINVEGFFLVSNCEELLTLVDALNNNPQINCDSGFFQTSLIIRECVDNPFSALVDIDYFTDNCVDQSEGVKVDGTFRAELDAEGITLSALISSDAGIAVNETDYIPNFLVDYDSVDSKTCAGSMRQVGQDTCQVSSDCQSCLFEN